MSEKSIFLKILDGEISSEILYQDEHCFAIRDIAPKAPTHLLLIPKKPVNRLVDATEADQQMLGHLLLKAGELAQRAGIGDAFRLIVNNGAGAGQTVFHLHIHILGNKQFAEDSLGF